MTPEFRNALYKWEFDGDKPTKSIPFQLQKLFLNLQVCEIFFFCFKLFVIRLNKKMLSIFGLVYSAKCLKKKKNYN